MGCGIEGQAILITSDDVTAFLFALLGRVVVLLTKGLPVGLVPEELLSLCYLVLFATVDGFFQPVWLDMVNDSSGHCSALPVAHDAERMRLQE